MIIWSLKLITKLKRIRGSGSYVYIACSVFNNSAPAVRGKRLPEAAAA